MSSTLNFYDNNAKELINRYDKVELKQLHSIFEKYIHIKSSVLDIGFGSGRDLRSIKKMTPYVFGIDSCNAFIKNMENNGFKNRVAKSVLPKVDITKFKTFIVNFDIVISIAVFMHFNVNDIDQIVKNIKKVLTLGGVVILSYSLERKIMDARHFEPLTKSIVTQIFNHNGFEEIESFQNFDVMNRSIEWVTQIFK